jgi:hypothetical protein
MHLLAKSDLRSVPEKTTQRKKDPPIVPGQRTILLPKIRLALGAGSYFLSKRSFQVSKKALGLLLREILQDICLYNPVYLSIPKFTLY